MGEANNCAALLTALNKVMAAVGYVQKDKKNAFHGYKYAGEEALLTVLRPALVEHGLVLIPSLDGVPSMDEHGNTNLTMAYTLAHVSGEVWPEKIRVPGCGNDRAKNGTMGDKGAYKALTGANKYMLFKLFQIATGDDPEVASEHDNSSERTVSPGVFAPTQDHGPAGEKVAGDVTMAALKPRYTDAMGDIESAEGDLEQLAEQINRHWPTIEQIVRRKPMWWLFKDEPDKSMRNRISAVVNATPGDTAAIRAKFAAINAPLLTRPVAAPSAVAAAGTPPF